MKIQPVGYYLYIIKYHELHYIPFMRNTKDIINKVFISKLREKELTEWDLLFSQIN